MTKIIITGGMVESADDQEVHYVSAKKLAELYGLVPYVRQVKIYMLETNEGRRRGISIGSYPGTTVELGPRADGRYKEIGDKVIKDLKLKLPA